MKRRVFLFVLSLNFLISGRSLADVNNRFILPVGETGSFVANTGIGRDGSSDAVFYNPAGLAGLNENTLSLTGSSYFSFRIFIESLASVGDESIGFEASAFNTIPSTLVSAQKWGAWTLGFSVIVPEATLTENNQNFDTAIVSGALVPYTNNNELWLGLSAARRFKNISVGATLFGIRKTASSIVGFLFDFKNDSEAATSVIERKESSHLGLNLTLGLMAHLSPSWDLGLKIQSAFYQISASGSVFSSTVSATSSGTTITLTEENDVKAFHYIPPDIGIGTSFKVFERFVLMADISHQFSSDFESFPDLESFSTRTKTKGTFRYNFGLEFLWKETRSILAGFSINPSAMDDLNTSLTGQMKATFTGFNLGLIFMPTKNSRTGLGLFYLTADGEAINDSSDISSAGATGAGAILTSAFVF